MRFDVRIEAPSTLRIENNNARLVSSAELTLRGTYDRPLLFGRAEIDRGEVLFEGNRYLVTRGTIDFANPTRIEPFFDIEAETRARVPGQTIASRSASRARAIASCGTCRPIRRCRPVDILALLFGDVRDPRDAELRALRSRDQHRSRSCSSRARRAVARQSDLVGGRQRGRARRFGVDTRADHAVARRSVDQQSPRLNPTARLTIGKRISERAVPDLRAAAHLGARRTVDPASSTTRATASRGSCRGTRTTPTRSTSASGTSSDAARSRCCAALRRVAGWRLGAAAGRRCSRTDRRRRPRTRRRRGRRRSTDPRARRPPS